MDSKCDAALYEVATRAFETLCFMYPVPEYNSESEVLGLGVEAAVSVGFSGPLKGELVLKVHKGLFYAIAANMLADEKPPTRQQMLDALGEIANIICGNVLPAIVGSREIFKLEPPKELELSELALFKDEKLLADVHLVLNQGCADVSLFVSDDAQYKRVE